MNLRSKMSLTGRDLLYASLIKIYGTITVYDFSIQGEERLPEQSIMAANHWGTYDTIPLSLGLEKRIMTVSKGPGRWGPPHFIPRIGRIPLSDGLRNSFELAHRYVARGYSLLTFPGGNGRDVYEDGKIGHVYRYTFSLAKRTGLPIIPVAIKGLKEIWPHDRIFPQLTGKLAINIGDPLRNSDDLKEKIESLYSNIGND